MLSQRRRQLANIKLAFFGKLMNIQYLNHPPHDNTDSARSRSVTSGAASLALRKMTTHGQRDSPQYRILMCVEKRQLFLTSILERWTSL